MTHEELKTAYYEAIKQENVLRLQAVAELYKKYDDSVCLNFDDCFDVGDYEVHELILDKYNIGNTCFVVQYGDETRYIKALSRDCDIDIIFKFLENEKLYSYKLASKI